MPNYKDAPEWKLCTPKEQKFLSQYLEPDEGESFDLLSSTKAAFDTKDDDTALTYGISILKRARIQKIIDFSSPTGGLPTLEEFKREVWSTIKTGKDPKVRFDSLTLYADLEGWRVRGVVKTPRPKDAGGDINPLDDIQYKQEEEI